MPGARFAAASPFPRGQAPAQPNLLSAVIDYPEDLGFHLQKAVLHTDSGIDLIAADRRLADSAAQLQAMQLSRYNAVRNAERASEKIMADLLEHLRSQHDYVIIDHGLKAGTGEVTYHGGNADREGYL